MYFYDYLMTAMIKLKILIKQNAKRTRSLFADTESIPNPKSTETADKLALVGRVHAEYDHVRELPAALAAKQAAAAGNREKKAKVQAADGESAADNNTMKMIEGIPSRIESSGAGSSSSLIIRGKDTPPMQTGQQYLQRKAIYHLVACLHPTLDVLVTGGRDGVARVWDMRTRSNIHVLSGHKGTVSDLKCQEADPQVITSSLDSTVRLWDLAAGKSMGVLTHHKKGVRALAIHPKEFTFASGSAGSIKQWKCPEGAFMQNFDGQNAIINTLSVNEDNVLFSGGDNGSMSFWDWKTGHRYQALDSIAQPGSLDAEAGIFTSLFDKTGLRLITGEADKTIKVWKQDELATPESHPLEWKPELGRRKF
ncbi:hypothetical protein DID88_010382 [Monilinia fructigena]|uniref:Pre-mRNA-splicing factor PRP46 n=1 Tax=Monilinia fructigena TaxID=38457 RepID=A0A395ICM2_9HELO|nr:hypothetical protein DID88_010382 [Monilinia fructigena]